MTAPTAAPARIHRRRTPTPGSARADQAARIRQLLDTNEPVTVAVDGYGRGWWVLDVGDGTYTVLRDGATLTVTWADVPVGSV
ncbi:hypothetical protein QQG74_09315 [Micromonospora sp. FIMYZ51]|uniref:hypothetical protein n=1 Tax=Micromonospora sp. FIMYZ51 TaxID=3051832 RepID=UPI00311F1EFA